MDEEVTQKPKYHSVSFAARYVPMLAKWGMTTEEYERAWFSQRRDTGGLQIEPADEGVYLTATNGERIAQIHDRTGHCDAPCILSLGEDFVNACRPFVGPKAVPVEDGPMYTVMTPEWLQPNRVIVHWGERTSEKETPFWLVMVTSGVIPSEHRDQERAEDEQAGFGFYKASSNHPTWRDAQPSAPDGFRALVPWQRIFDIPAQPEPVTRLTMQTRFLSDLQYLGDVCELVFDKATSALHARFADSPHIRAAIMPMQGRTPEEKQRDIELHDRRERDRMLALQHAPVVS